MSFTVFHKQEGNTTIRMRIFYVQDLVGLGKWKNELMNEKSNPPEVVMIRADGHELEYLVKVFPNIPYRVAYCTWRGEMAQFIFDNI